MHNLFESRKVEWITVVLAVIATSPWLVKMMAKNIDEFVVGQKGISIKTKTVDEVRPGAQNPPTFNQLTPTFSQLTPQVRRILTTLWRFQEQFFPGDDKRRWGFRSDSPDFQKGLLNAIALGLVWIDEREYCFLTDAGMKYCREYADEIIKEKDYYDRFNN